MRRAHPVVCIIGLSFLICAAYLPTLAHPFDFVDDGCLVYPQSTPASNNWLAQIWDRTTFEYKYRGPFRPITWAHWVGQANLFGPNPVYHRLFRLGWAVLSAGMLLWLFRELGIHPIAAFLAAAAAMWNPLRNEIWLGLGLTEAFAMPYALLALICAVRAGRSRKSWCWDLLGVAMMLAALACKNTFAAVVPVQMFLRLAAGGLDWRVAFRRNCSRAVALGLTLLLPVIHLIALKWDNQPRQYQISGLTLRQTTDMLKFVVRAANVEYIALGLACLLACLWWQRFQHESAPQTGEERIDAKATVGPRVSVIAAMLLLILGIGIYLPIGAVAGRYTMPAVWGVDILLALLLTKCIHTLNGRLRTPGFALLAVGLAAVLMVNVTRQDRYCARSQLLWTALHHVEQNSPQNSGVVFQGVRLPTSRNQLATSEGTHFAWHLHARGRPDLIVHNLEKVQPTVAIPAAYALTTDKVPPTTGTWRLARELCSSYWFGMRSFRCYLWEVAQ